MTTPYILIVDDDPSILSMLSEVLGDERYATRLATNGAEGLLAMSQELPALVLLDMRMPTIDGWEFVDTMRERGIEVPVLVMTAAQDARQWAHEVDAAGYIAKPFDLDELIDAVARLLPPPPPPSDSAVSSFRLLDRLFPTGPGLANPAA